MPPEKNKQMYRLRSGIDRKPFHNAFQRHQGLSRWLIRLWGVVCPPNPLSAGLLLPSFPCNPGVTEKQERTHSSLRLWVEKLIASFLKL